MTDNLGPDWPDFYSRTGSGQMAIESGNAKWVELPPPTDVDYQLISARMGEQQDRGLEIHGGTPGIGARLTKDSLCTGCRKRLQAGDVVTILCAPDMAGTWHHNDCEDPTLANQEDQ